MKEESIKKKRNPVLFVFQVLFFIIIFSILGNIILGVINFNQLYHNQEPYIFTSCHTYQDNGITYEEYPQGLFHIIYQNDGKEEKWTLEPFFM